MTEQYERVSHQRMRVIMEHHFFSEGMYSLKLIEDPSIPTFCTDGVELRYNPEFAKGLNEREIRTVHVHEVLHCLLQHPWRLDGRDPGVWNEACDYVINLFINDYSRQHGSCFSLPRGALLDYRYNNKSADEVYDLLIEARNKPQPPQPQPQPQPPQPQSPGDQPGEGEGEGDGEGKPGEGEGKPGEGEGEGKPGEGKPGEGKPGEGKPGEGEGEGEGEGKPGEGKPGEGKPGEGAGKPVPKYQQCPTGHFNKAPITSKDGKNLQAQWAVRYAEACAGPHGKDSLAARRLLEQSNAQDVSWQDILQRFVSERTPTDYSYARPDPRLYGLDVIMPAIDDDSAGEMVFAIDMSGSVSDKLVGQFLSEAQYVLDTIRPKEMHLVYFDSSVCATETLHPGDTITKHPCGGGGTDFRPVFRWIDEQRLTPLCVVFLTDLYGEFPSEDPGIPTLWCVYGNSNPKAPFGEVSRIKTTH